MLGKPFMPWQQYVADVILEIDPETGRLAYSEFGLTVPRQSGKSTFILAKSIHRGSATAFFGRRQNMVYTAQTRKDARKKFELDYAAQIEASKVFKNRVGVHWGNGNEHFRFTNGSRFGIESATEKSGHGGIIDAADIDEAFAQIDGRLEQAFRPAMITRPNKQLGWISTAGWVDGSPYLEGKTRLGRAAVTAGRRSGLAYFEWSALEGQDPADPETWLGCMPALGHTITLEAIRDEFLSMPDVNDFKRAYLNLWVPKPVGTENTAIDLAGWAATEDAESRPESVSAFAVEIDIDRAWSAIGIAGRRADALVHVETVDHRPGTGWLVARAVELNKRHGPAPFVVDRGGPAAGLIRDLRDAGLDVVEVGTAEVAHAYALLVDAVTEKSLRHGPQPDSLDLAVESAKTRPCGDGGQAFGRRASGGSISSLVSVSLAHRVAVVGIDMSAVNNVW